MNLFRCIVCDHFLETRSESTIFWDYLISIVIDLVVFQIITWFLKFFKSKVYLSVLKLLLKLDKYENVN
jgi:hypothetical protein